MEEKLNENYMEHLSHADNCGHKVATTILSVKRYLQQDFHLLAYQTIRLLVCLHDIKTIKCWHLALSRYEHSSFNRLETMTEFFGPTSEDLVRCLRECLSHVKCQQVLMDGWKMVMVDIFNRFKAPNAPDLEWWSWLRVKRSVRHFSARARW